MIFEALLSFCYFILGAFLQLLPLTDPATTAKITQYTSSFRSYAAGAAWFFPIDTIFGFMAVVFAIELVIFTYKVVRWVMSMLTVGVVK